MFQLYLHDEPAAIRFNLIGELTSADVVDIRQTWHTASSTMSGRPLIVDIASLANTDDEGAQLLQEFADTRAVFVSASEFSDSLASRLSGRKPVEAPGRRLSAWSRVICRFRNCRRRIAVNARGFLPCWRLHRKVW